MERRRREKATTGNENVLVFCKRRRDRTFVEREKRRKPERCVFSSFFVVAQKMIDPF